MKKITMKRIAIRGIRAWFRKHDWAVKEGKLPGGDVIFLAGVAADTPAAKWYDLAMTCRETYIESALYLRSKVPREHYPEVAEYLMRLNDHFTIGKLVLDYDDGQVCHYVVKDSKALTSGLNETMDDLIGFTKYACDRFAIGISQIVTGIKTAEQAYVEVVAKDDTGDSEPENVETVIQKLPQTKSDKRSHLIGGKAKRARRHSPKGCVKNRRKDEK